MVRVKLGGIFSASAAGVFLLLFFPMLTMGSLPRWREAQSGPDGTPTMPLLRGVNGGTSCGVCTLLVSLSEQLAEIHNKTIVQGLEMICSYLPDDFQSTCRSFLDIATPILIEMAFNKYLTPDVACLMLNFCYSEADWPTCHLYPLPSSQEVESLVQTSLQTVPRIHRKDRTVGLDIDCDNLPIFKEFCELIKKRFGDDHLPLEDIDNDYHSVMKTLRGSYWRGKDCNDLVSEFHPGMKAINNDELFDSDCNGIYGFDPLHFKPYEKTLCGQTPRMGTVILGDSAGAHFHLPKEWFTASELSVEAFKDVLMIVENEFDWPMTSAITGFMNSTWSVLSGPTNSLYMRMRELNHCNHRDFQNIGVNGADSHSMNSSVQYGLSRDQQRDHPALVIYSLLGNDVCNGHNDTISRMTTPQEMKANFLATLEYLDTVLPNGSYVFATGMADGTILYDTLKNRIHPIGEWRKDVTYPDVYNYLSCLQVSPCNGWLSSNESLRNFTSARAAELSSVLQRVAATHTAKNFKVHYIDFDFKAVIQIWKSMGGETWQLIEPVDGFHPSQIAMSLSLEVLWKEIEQIIPDVINTWSNPNNARIKALFGDQGGYL